MLSSVEIANFFSIKEKLKLSFDFRSNRSSMFNDNCIYSYIEDGKKRNVLDGALIYGANASGKTNILKAFKFLNQFVASSKEIKSYEDSKDLKELISPFTLCDNVDNIVKINLKNIIINDDTHHYKTNYVIHYDSKLNVVDYERLSFQKIKKTKLGKEEKLFERSSSKITSYSDNIRTIMEKASKENIKYNSLFFYIVNDINDDFYKDEISSNEYLLIRNLYNEIKESYGPVSGDQAKLQKLAMKISEDNEFKNGLLEKLSDFDFSITDFYIEDNLNSFIENMDNNDTIDDSLKKTIISFFKSTSRFTIKTIHKNSNTLNIDSESSGTNKFLSDYFYLNKTFSDNLLFIEDEFDSKYHVKIQESILDDFKSFNGNVHSQFLITTQNPLLLNPNKWAKEQINFVDKQRNTEDTLIRTLSEYENVTYNNHNWMNLYLDGRFGSIPEVL